MHVIIDGYNLLGALRQIGPDSESAREGLVRDLMAYGQRKGHPVTIVFDGWKQGLGTERHEHRTGVEVIYSKRGERADQVIQRLAAECGRDCAVVSSDREIIGFAKAQGAFVIRAGEFLSLLYGAPIAELQSARMPARRDREDDDLPKRNPEKKGNPKKLPKALRKRNRQLRGF